MEHEFRLSPLDASVNKYAKVFTLAYNRALDFKKFQDELKLLPHAFYYPPSCMMAEFCKFMPVLEKDKDNYILGREELPETNVNKGQQDMESHQGTKNKAKKVCSHCGQSKHECHLELYADYCYAHLYRTFMSYTPSITEETCKKVYLKWYNSALHYHTWETTSTYVSKMIQLPPSCLAYQMQFDVDTIMQKKDRYRTK